MRLDPQTLDFRYKTYPPVFLCEVQDPLRLILQSLPSSYLNGYGYRFNVFLVFQQATEQSLITPSSSFPTHISIGFESICLH